MKIDREVFRRFWNIIINYVHSIFSENSIANLPEFWGLNFGGAVLVVTTDGKENGSLRPRGRRALDFEGRDGVQKSSSSILKHESATFSLNNARRVFLCVREPVAGYRCSGRSLNKS